MIASIQGKVINKGSDYLLISVEGLGFQIFTTHETVNKSRVGDIFFLYTQMIVREDAISLYGFESEIEKQYFNMLLGVSGVGPRMALSILTTISLDLINQSVLSEQPEIFARVSGVGKKTAQKIIIHLQGRIQSESGIGLVSSRIKDTDIEILDALTALGYSIVEAQAAIQSIPSEFSLELEDRLKAALKYFS
ncbi:MAG: Holliday junction branch migration protein RuvA [Anaerolineaceae bacterium]|jgi:Holliday junction DNA helicase RuvA|nr:MAG: Holliday junction branch migration protein RuvA [Chloroflexi bacterium HGW-Chloroflexi-8]